MSKVLSCTIICNINDNAEGFLDVLSGLQLNSDDDVQLILITTSGLTVSVEPLSPCYSEVKCLTLPPAYSEVLLFDRAIADAIKEYLIFLRQPLTVTKDFLAFCLEEVSKSTVKIRTANDNRMVVVEREYLINNGMSAAIINSKSYDPIIQPVHALKQRNKGVFKDLFNRPVTLEYGPGSYIDPEVVVDSPEKIHIGSNTIIRKGVVLRPEGGEIVIGNNCVINHYCDFRGKGGIYLGDWSIIESHCGFFAQNHSYDRFDIPITQQPNTGNGIYLMGDNWIGGHSVICDDVTLGKGVVIEPNSTVTGSIPMASVAVGSPAFVIKKRFEENYVFQHRERATHVGMPEDIIQYVQTRGKLISSLIDPNDVVLDIGCGEGIITSMIAEKAINTIGCDYCDDTIKEARIRYPNVKFMQSNVTSLKFDSNYFTKVNFTEVAEHLLPIQLENTLEEIVRVLRLDGVLLITTPITGAGLKTSCYAHIYEYSLREITALLSVYFNEVYFVNPTFGLFVAKNKK